MKETNNVEQRPSTSLSKGARRNQILRRITVVGVIAAVITAAFAGYCLHRERVEEKQKAEEQFFAGVIFFAVIFVIAADRTFGCQFP